VIGQAEQHWKAWPASMRTVRARRTIGGMPGREAFQEMSGSELNDLSPVLISARRALARDIWKGSSAQADCLVAS
jgi:hypothetical protein